MPWKGRGHIDINIKDEPQQVMIDLSDTGKGISPGNMCRRVFDPGIYDKKKGLGSWTYFVKTNHGNLS